MSRDCPGSILSSPLPLPIMVCFKACVSCLPALIQPCPDDFWLEPGLWLSRLLAAEPTFNNASPCSLPVRLTLGKETLSVSGET